MDHRIYGRGVLAIGDRIARRIPRGSGDVSMAPVPGGGTPLSSNPTPLDMAFGFAAIAPHGTTDRASYTVPPNRRATIQSVHLVLERNVVAAPVAEYATIVWLRRKGNTSSRGTKILFLKSWDNTAPKMQDKEWAEGAIELFEGDTILFQSYDNSTGGLCGFSLDLIGTEFDAVEPVRAAILLGNNPNEFGAVQSAPAATSSSSTTTTRQPIFRSEPPTWGFGGQFGLGR